MLAACSSAPHRLVQTAAICRFAAQLSSGPTDALQGIRALSSSSVAWPRGSFWCERSLSCPTSRRHKKRAPATAKAALGLHCQCGVLPGANLYSQDRFARLGREEPWISASQAHMIQRHPFGRAFEGTWAGSLAQPAACRAPRGRSQLVPAASAGDEGEPEGGAIAAGEGGRAAWRRSGHRRLPPRVRTRAAPHFMPSHAVRYNCGSLRPNAVCGAPADRPEARA